jgi:hypothetical protein
MSEGTDGKAPAEDFIQPRQGLKLLSIQDCNHLATIDKKRDFQISLKALSLLVGTTRFELATSRTPTYLRANRKFSKWIKAS